MDTFHNNRLRHQFHTFINSLSSVEGLDYDPSKVTLNEIRPVLDKLHSDRDAHHTGRNHGQH